jgi:hypothetical protein
MKNIPKKSHENATLKAERLMIDSSWIKTESIANNQYWLLVMDEYKNFLWSFFLKHRDDKVQIVIQLIERLQNETNVKVNYVCFDDSGENHDIQTTIQDCHPSIKCKFEYTAPDSPQQNGNIERKFAKLYGRVWAMA